MDGLAYYQEMDAKLKQLEQCIRDLRNTGSDFAAKEREYQVRKREYCLRLKSDGMPVSLIQMTYKGIPELASLRYDLMAAEAIYKANQEAVMSLKLQIRILDNQIARELGNPSVGSGGM